MSATHARTSDPRSSEVAVRSICIDSGLAALAMKAAQELQAMAHRFGDEPVFNDTELVEAMERIAHGRRLQRNVIAKIRGRLVDNNHLIEVGPRDYRGTSLEHFRIPPPITEQPALF